MNHYIVDRYPIDKRGVAAVNFWVRQDLFEARDLKHLAEVMHRFAVAEYNESYSKVDPTKKTFKIQSIVAQWEAMAIEEAETVCEEKDEENIEDVSTQDEGFPSLQHYLKWKKEKASKDASLNIKDKACPDCGISGLHWCTGRGGVGTFQGLMDAIGLWGLGITIEDLQGKKKEIGRGCLRDWVEIKSGETYSMSCPCEKCSVFC